MEMIPWIVKDCYNKTIEPLYSLYHIIWSLARQKKGSQDTVEYLQFYVISLNP